MFDPLVAAIAVAILSLVTGLFAFGSASATRGLAQLTCLTLALAATLLLALTAAGLDPTLAALADTRTTG